VFGVVATRKYVNLLKKRQEIGAFFFALKFNTKNNHPLNGIRGTFYFTLKFNVLRGITTVF